MRDDMHKLIKENGRNGGGWAKIKPVGIDDEDNVARQAMRPRVGGWNLKERHDWTAPLERYLASQVGRAWDDVYSEICAHNSIHSYTQRDVREAVDYLVHTNIVIEDGAPHTTEGNRIWRNFWVHPETGVLTKAPEAKRYRWRGYRKNYNQVPCDDTHKYVQIEGLWYMVTFAAFDQWEFEQFVAAARKAYRPVIYDVVFKTELSTGFDRARETLAREWGGVVYAVAKRQIGRRKIKEVTAKWAAIELAREAT